MAIVATDIYNESIDTVYVDLVSIYELNSSGTVVRAVHMNNCGESIQFNDAANGGNLFGNQTYMPVNFELTMPDTTSVNEQTGSINIGGVTSTYIAQIQQATGTLYLRDSLIKLSEASEGEYIIYPVDIEIASITINSATATISVSLKSGGILSFYASKYEYNVNNFPSISG